MSLPAQNIVPDAVLRLVMLAGSLLVPAIIGLLVVALERANAAGRRAVAVSLARGYPLTVLLAVLLIFLAGLAIWRRAMSLRRGWTDAHVPFVVKPGAYDQVAEDLTQAITGAGLEVSAGPASAVMSARQPGSRPQPAPMPRDSFRIGWCASSAPTSTR